MRKSGVRKIPKQTIGKHFAFSDLHPGYRLLDKEKRMHNFHSGTSGLLLPVPNKLAYPPDFQDKSRLTYYASLNNSIEINSSFYKVPMAATVKNWAASVPDDFRFTFKMWKEITHNKFLLFDAQNVKRFMDAVLHVGLKKGCLLLQLPPKLTIENIGQLTALLIEIRESDSLCSWKVALEFRSKSWYTDECYELLNRFKASQVIHDRPPSGTFIEEPEGDFVYLRFHGINGNYRGSYSDDFLYEYAQYIKAWLAEGKEVYAYFNNTMGSAVQNLTTLKSYVKM